MFVSKSMTQKVITLERDASIFEAQELMFKNRVRHIPVVDNDNILIGIVTDRDIRTAMPYDLFKDPENAAARNSVTCLKVRDIMTINPITIQPTHTIQDALLMILKQKVGAFPVVDDKHQLKGIISVRDLLRAFANVLGIGQPGTLLGIIAKEKVGQLKIIVDAITAKNISIGSILVARYWEKDKRAVFPYLLTNNVGPIKRDLQALGYTLIDPMDWCLDEIPK
ncbi:MAG: CBS domain-containing protein [Desulfobacteraceae bacterium]|nr:CBS domain-containing protein [Desulfobacteraceae bacterium]